MSSVPDAIQCPTSWKYGTDADSKTDNALSRGMRLFDRLEAAMDVNREAGEQVWVRDQSTYLFVTKNLADTLLFPADHPRDGQSRYRWVDQGNQVKHGYLVEGA